jgi:hypothetical protein
MGKLHLRYKVLQCMDPDTFFWGYLSVVGFSIHTAIWYVTTAARILGCTDRSSVRHSVSPSFSH